MKQDLLIGLIIIIIAIIGITAIFGFSVFNQSFDSNSIQSIFSSSNSSDEEVSTLGNDKNQFGSNNSSSSDEGMDNKSWHKIGSYSGVWDNTITLTNGGNRIKLVSSAMPVKNYADNYMLTTVSKNGYSVGSSKLSWNSRSAVATKTKNIEFSGSGTHYIYISAYELQYWNLEIYEYY